MMIMMMMTVMFNNYFFSGNRADYEIMWKKKMVQPDRSRMTKEYGKRPLRAEHLRLRTNTQNKKKILIAFPQQQWLRECASVLLVYKRIQSLIMISVNNTRPYRNNGKNAHHISHDLFHFPLPHTSRYSPPASFQVRSHECERRSHTKQVTGC